MAQFQKGHSGNPGGRPKMAPELKELCKAKATDAIKTLAEIMQDEKAPSAARVSAACALLDRGYGKPVQMTELTGKDGGPVEVTDVREVAKGLAYLITVGAEEPEQSETRH